MSELTNPLLQQAQDKIEAGLTPENRADYMKIVVAGLHIALDKGPNGLLASMAKSHDPIADAAKTAVSLVILMSRESKGVMPPKAMVPAALTLMLHALDFADRSKIVAIGEPELVRATHIFGDTVFARFGISKAGLANATQRVHALTQDSGAMTKIQMKAGLLKHPLAATPTPLPDPQGASGLINETAR